MDRSANHTNHGVAAHIPLRPQSPIGVVSLLCAGVYENHPMRLARAYKLPAETCLKYCRTLRMSSHASVAATSKHLNSGLWKTRSDFTDPKVKTSSRTTSPLLDLPPELRNWIYEAILIEPDPITVARPPLFRDWAAHPLLHTCRLIRNEASQIYWSSNTFVPDSVADIDRMVAWLVMIGPRQYHMMRKMFLNDRYYLRETKAKMAIRAYSNSLVYAGIHIAQKVFYIHAFVDSLREPIWLNMPDMVFLRTNERR
ncbi:hypothetical protein LTR85_005333 [Meristemomyces frigidus]|nr:hypothetical protein LTR85_005333 [Meristemomyces frigidus]